MGRECSTDWKVSHMALPKTPCAEESRGNLVNVGSAGGRPLHYVSDDVVFYVGQSRRTYTVSSESLTRSSAYFRNMMKKTRGAPIPPVVMDCEEGVFEGLLLLMRYGSWEALPPLSHAQAFRLKAEAELYGVHFLEPSKTPDSPASSPDGSPKSIDTNTRPLPSCRRLSGRLCDGVRMSAYTSRKLVDLPDFPLDIADPSKLVLVTCLDEEKAPIYACEHCSKPGTRPPSTQWALSFHYRHAFCTACGLPPTKMPPKFFAEMFTGAAAQYSQSTAQELQAATTCKPASNWRVGSDSTCLVRLVSSIASGPDACDSATCAASSSSGQHSETVWAATFFYSHAFCTCCGQTANGSILLSLLLALRYGGATTKGSSRSSFKVRTAAEGR